MFRISEEIAGTEAGRPKRIALLRAARGNTRGSNDIIGERADARGKTDGGDMRGEKVGWENGKTKSEKGIRCERLG